MSTIPVPATIPPSVQLTETDRARLHMIVHRGHTRARTRTRARVLLKLGDGWSDLAVRDAFAVCRNTVQRVRARLVAGGMAPYAQTWQLAQHGRDRDQRLRARRPVASGR